MRLGIKTEVMPLYRSNLGDDLAFCRGTVDEFFTKTQVIDKTIDRLLHV
jgi:hypothetical protein